MDVKFKTLQAVVNGYFKSEILEGVDCSILQLDSKFQYKVVGVVYHIGEEKDSGHYTAAVKCASQHFFYYDDVTVSIALLGVK